MKKTVIVCGLIAGAIITIMMTISTTIYCSKGDFEHGMIYGYAGMIICFSMILVGTKNFRDKYNDGIISFGKGFKIGMLITLIASTMYVIGWLINYYFFIPDFADKYAAYMIDKAKAAGASQTELNKTVLQMANLKEMYKNPIFTALLTYAEIVPVGLVVSLISALIFKRKIKAPSQSGN
jgi:hypothetical protein